MKNPWTSNDKAYDPMFYDTLSAGTTTMQVSMMLDNTGDPFSEGAMDTKRIDVLFIIRPADYPTALSLKRGNSLDYGTKHYKVSDVVEDYALGVIVKAREN